MTLHRFLNEYINHVFRENQDNTKNKYFDEYYNDPDTALWQELDYLGFDPSPKLEKKMKNPEARQAVIKDFVLKHLEDEVVVSGKPEGRREYTMTASIDGCEFFFTGEVKTTFVEFAE
jgi:hypothetical protein